MNIKEKDLKLLWGRSGGRCAFEDCRRPLAVDRAHQNDAIPIGEQAHIVAEEENGPRGKSILSPQERSSYPNLILLCPTHHTIIDKDPIGYPVEKLHIIKRIHELHIEQSTASVLDRATEAANLIYSTLIDSVVELCDLGDWKIWTSRVLGVQQVWSERGIDKIYEFGEKILGAAFPGRLEELERCLKSLSFVLTQARSIYLEHARHKDDEYRGEKFYKVDDYDAEAYNRLLTQYEKWVEDLDEWIILATKCGNWFLNVVRQDINPHFFAVEGNLLLVLQQGLGYQTSLYTFTDEEKAAMPQKALDLAKIRYEKNKIEW